MVPTVGRHTEEEKGQKCFLFDTNILILTLFDVFDGSAYASVKGTGISRALERQTKFLVIDPPVVEDRVDLVVYQISLQNTLQDHLKVNKMESNSQHRKPDSNLLTLHVG